MKFALTFWLAVSQNVSANNSIIYEAMSRNRFEVGSASLAQGSSIDRGMLLL